jgi:hypothetical protein
VLCTHGALRIPDLLSTADVGRCRAALAALRPPLLASTWSGRVGDSLAGTAGVTGQSEGRVHLSLFHGGLAALPASERAWLAAVAAPLAPLIRQHMGLAPAADRTGRGGGGGESSGGVCGDGLRLTQLQFVESWHPSAAQVWHCDNVRRGVTVLIPLVDTTPRNGPTELLLGSHAFFPQPASLTGVRGDSGFVPWDWSCVAAAACSVVSVRALLAAGDALVYDSRTLHRGTGHCCSHQPHASEPPAADGPTVAAVVGVSTGEAPSGSNSAPTRPVLILRFDADATPPPGVRLVGTMLVRGVAGAVMAGGETKARFQRLKSLAGIG